MECKWHIKTFCYGMKQIKDAYTLLAMQHNNSHHRSLTAVYRYCCHSSSKYNGGWNLAIIEGVRLLPLRLFKDKVGVCLDSSQTKSEMLYYKLLSTELNVCHRMCYILRKLCA